MNVAMEMTMDALLRSLRSLAHGVADRVELKPVKRAKKATRRAPARVAKEVSDERRR